MKREDLLEKLEKTIKGIKQPEKPDIKCWVAKKLPDGQIGVSVSPSLEGKEFVLIDDVIEYIDYLDKRLEETKNE